MKPEARVTLCRRWLSGEIFHQIEQYLSTGRYDQPTEHDRYQIMRRYYAMLVERGEKEASSELLASICAALHLPMSQMLSDVSDRAAESEAVSALLTLPMPQRPDTLVSASAA